MIALWLALAALQAPPSDAARAVLDTTEQCMAVMTGRAEAPAGSVTIVLADGREARAIVRRDGCSLNIEGWRGDDGKLAGQVRDGLMSSFSHWTVSQWRELRVSESGPARWTSIVFPDIRRHSAFWVQIIEPEPGAPDRLAVSFGIAP